MAPVNAAVMGSHINTAAITAAAAAVSRASVREASAARGETMESVRTSVRLRWTRSSSRTVSSAKINAPASAPARAGLARKVQFSEPERGL